MVKTLNSITIFVKLNILSISKNFKIKLISCYYNLILFYAQIFLSVGSPPYIISNTITNNLKFTKSYAMILQIQLMKCPSQLISKYGLNEN